MYRAGLREKAKFHFRSALGPLSGKPRGPWGFSLEPPQPGQSACEVSGELSDRAGGLGDISSLIPQRGMLLFLSQGKSKLPSNSVLLRALSGTRWLPRSGCQSPEGDVCPRAGRQAWLRPGTKRGSDLPLRFSGSPSSNPHTRPKISIWALGLEDWRAGTGSWPKAQGSLPGRESPVGTQAAWAPVPASCAGLPARLETSAFHTNFQKNKSADRPRPPGRY